MHSVIWSVSGCSVCVSLVNRGIPCDVLPLLPSLSLVRALSVSALALMAPPARERDAELQHRAAQGELSQHPEKGKKLALRQRNLKCLRS